MSQWFPWINNSASRSWTHHNNITTNHFDIKGKSQVDILLNVDECKLNSCVVGKCGENKEAKMWNLPKPKTKGWIPHFNLGRHVDRCHMICRWPVASKF